MGNFVKWIGGVIGLILGILIGRTYGWERCGVFGCILGFVVGTVIDSLELRIFNKTYKNSRKIDFTTNLLMLIAAIMKAEQPVKKSELKFVKQFLIQNFGDKGAVKALANLKEILTQNIPLDEACTQIHNDLDYTSRLQFLHFLHNLAKVDGKTTEAEQVILNIIANNLQITYNNQKTAIKEIHDEAIIEAYDILGINFNASVNEVKKAYRNSVIKYHPDKQVFLGEEQQKSANEKFLQLKHAYDIIKRDRNFS